MGEYDRGKRENRDGHVQTESPEVELLDRKRISPTGVKLMVLPSIPLFLFLYQMCSVPTFKLSSLLPVHLDSFSFFQDTLPISFDCSLFPFHVLVVSPVYHYVSSSLSTHPLPFHQQSGLIPQSDSLQMQPEAR